MPKITDISLTLHGSTLLFFLLILAGLAAIYFMYRSTTPPAESWRRISLALLRSGALLSIIGLLFTPIFSVSIEQSKKPVIAVLVDTSSSMSVVDKAADRRAAVVDLLGNTVFSELDEAFDVRYYAFDRKESGFTRDSVDSLSFDGVGTNIASALQFAAEQARNHDLGGIILISDGNYNLGENPVNIAARLGVPVIPVGVGDAALQRDILISNLQITEIAYAGSAIPVTVSIKGSGFGGAASTVVLASEGETLDSRIIQLPDDNRERTVTLNFTPSEAKVQKLSVSVSPQENEIETSNNRREFYVKVLESRINILIAAGKPSQDYAFLRRSLEINENFSVTGIVQRQAGYYYSQADDILNRLDSFHLFILVDFPGSAGFNDLTRALVQEIETTKKPVMYIRGSLLSARQLQPFMDIVSIKGFNSRGSPQIRGREEEVYFQLTQPALEHPVFRIVDEPGENAALWKKLPPLVTAANVPIPAESAVIMGRIDINRTTKSVFTPSTPLLFLNRFNERKSLFFNVYNIWRWSLMALRDEDLAGLYDTFMLNCVRWLINREDSKLFHLATNKELYQNGEQVVINAQVYTENYEPIDDADVQVTIQKPGVTITRILQSFGSGRYTTTLEILEPGEYTITGDALQGKRKIGNDTAEYVIGEYNIELFKTSMDSALLAQVAAVSGSRYFDFQDVGSLPEALDAAPDIVQKNIDIEIWDKAWLLAAIITLLCLEWFIRKRLGML